MKNKKTKKVKRKCKICNKSFYVYPSDLKKENTGLHCSVKCQHQGQKNRIPHNKGEGDIELICVNCGEKFTSKKYKVNKGKGKFCNKNCEAKYRTTKIKLNCKHCGGEIYKTPSAIKDGRGNYCSRECQLKHFGKTNLEKKGENIIKELNINFKTQYRIGRYIADVYLPQSMVVIEWDGDYWHNLPGMLEKDRRKDRYLTKSGYTVLRLQENQVYNKPERVKKEILRTIALNNA